MRDFKGMKRQRGRNRKPGGGASNAIDTAIRNLIADGVSVADRKSVV